MENRGAFGDKISVYMQIEKSRYIEGICELFLSILRAWHLKVGFLM